jgi:hypothetical protein
MDRTWTTILTEDAEFESGLRFAIMDATPLEVIQSAMTPPSRPPLCLCSDLYLPHLSLAQIEQKA